MGRNRDSEEKETSTENVPKENKRESPEKKSERNLGATKHSTSVPDMLMFWTEKYSAVFFFAFRN
jgi:hypothetical protein